MQKILISLGIASLVLWQGFLEYEKLSPDTFVLSFLDVNLGDATLIQTPSGQNIIIDTSSSSGWLTELAKHLSVFDKTIDILVLSHGDSDHIGGAISLLQSFNVKVILWNGADKQSPVFDELENIIEEKNISTIALNSQTDFDLGSGITLNNLYPFESIEDQENQTNNDSLNFIFDIDGHKVLFTGDSEKEVEQELLLSGLNLESEILKVGHHGSRTSSSQSFLEAVHPKYAVAMADIGNQFGHPHKEVVDRFAENEIEFLQTGLEGTIQFCIDAEELNRCN